MWRFRWHGIAAAWVAGLLGMAGVSMYKDRYEASAKVYVDTQTVLKPLMSGLAFQPDIDQQVKMLARTLITRPNVEQLMKSPSVGLPQPTPERMDIELERLKSKIRFESSGAGNLYAISYRDNDPMRARRVVETLLNLFMNQGASVKQRDSTEAGRFIDEQIKSYELKLTEAENRVKDYKLRNFGVSGVSNMDYYARVSALSDEINKIKLELSSAEQSRDALRRELATEDPQLPPESMPSQGGAVAPTETDARLDTLRRQLDDLMRRYTESHPDVVSARRAITQLEALKRQEQERQARDGKRGTAATNPVFQKLRVSLAEAEAHVAALRTQLSVQQSRLEQARAMANRIPSAEAELSQLNRDYDILRKNYEQLVSRREAASLGVKIDQSSSMADFRVVEPPQASPVPVMPSRKLLSAAGLLAAVLAGLGTALVASRLSGAIDDEATLRALVQRPVLGTVTLVKTEQSMRRARRDLLAFNGALVALLVVNVGWIAWLSTGGRL